MHITRAGSTEFISLEEQPTSWTSDGRKYKALELAIVAIALLFLTVVGGVITFLIIRFTKNSSGENMLWKGLKYQMGMHFNLKDMRQKDFSKCGLTGDGARVTDDIKTPAQWANTVFKEGGYSLILSAQLTEGQVESFALLGGTTVIAAQERWEQRNERGLVQFAEIIEYQNGTYKDLPVKIGAYKDRDDNDLEVKQVLVDLPDHHAIGVEKLDALADLIKEEIKIGHVNVHCKSGRGRSAQIIVAYLIKHQSKSVQEAVDIVSTARRFADVKKAKLIKLFEDFKTYLTNKI